MLGWLRTLISIHALLAESDSYFSVFNLLDLPFLSTLSLRRATVVRVCEFVWGVSISIHALLAESDLMLIYIIIAEDYFYPRSPCGERPLETLAGLSYFLFLSTLSLRRATWLRDYSKQYNVFLSTLSLRRATLSLSISVLWMVHFYPRSPCGERPYCKV